MTALPGRALCAPHAEIATVMEGWIHVPPHRKYTPCAACGGRIGLSVGCRPPRCVSSRGQFREWWPDSSSDATATGSAGSLRRWRGIRTAARYGGCSDGPDGALPLRHANPLHELANDFHGGDSSAVLPYVQAKVQQLRSLASGGGGAFLARCTGAGLELLHV